MNSSSLGLGAKITPSYFTTTQMKLSVESHTIRFYGHREILLLCKRRRLKKKIHNSQNINGMEEDFNDVFFFCFLADSFYLTVPSSTPFFPFLSIALAHPAIPFFPGSQGEVAGGGMLCRAILSQRDTAMIVAAASHCHPGISVWTVMSQTCEKPVSYYQIPLHALFCDG